MKIKPINIFDALKGKPIRHKRYSQIEIDQLINNTNRLLSTTSENNTEENQKNHIRDFLKNTYYRQNYEINTKGNIDLVIHTGKSSVDPVGVIIETKRIGNKSEMITLEKPNVKAFHELILYYLLERIEHNNINITYCIITNTIDWFIFDAIHFERHFINNKEFLSNYKEWKTNRKVSSNTQFFYEHIAKPYLDLIDVDLPCIKLNLAEYANQPITDNATALKFTYLHHIFSPEFLLKIPYTIDKNNLNRDFYEELLHLIGLEEIKDASKRKIVRKKSNKQPGSLVENIITVLQTENINIQYGFNSQNSDNPSKEELLFDTALQLSMLWVNRILFLKLLEAQLINYHKGDSSYKFLTITLVTDYHELYKLFHQVLSVKPEDRNQTVVHKYKAVPYLNSSLFEISELERQTIRINALDNKALLSISDNSILKKATEFSQESSFLYYLFLFLDAYDFTDTEAKIIKESTKKHLVNASVLGKIFEKLNGYKDGSVFTPAIITDYMSRQAIRLRILDKFREEPYKWKVEQWDELKNYIADKKSSKEILAFNEVVNNIKICDPAVGSGHFLVSALNELIAIKADLGIFADNRGIKFTNFEITVDSDELFVCDSAGIPFQYLIHEGKPATSEIQRLQIALFHEKQKIIENCLFGVDINPVSIQICRLRLWIELLKNAYYKEPSYKELETLPNIDINIKCGNSLLSRFAFDADLTNALKSINSNIHDYKKLVDSYKKETNSEIRVATTLLINNIKSKFSTEIGKQNKKQIELNKYSSELFNLLNPVLHDVVPEDIKKNEEKRKLLESKIDSLQKEIDLDKANPLYNTAFEWRFEFPETMNSKIEFEGFDIIIGNPPYIESRGNKIDDRLKVELSKKIVIRNGQDASLITRGSDLLIYFFELGLYLLKPNGYFSFITENAWLDTDYGTKFQQFLLKKTTIRLVLDYNQKYFDSDSANINTVITLFCNRKPLESDTAVFCKFNAPLAELASFPNEINPENTPGKVNLIPHKSETLKKYKWGILLNADPVIELMLQRSHHLCLLQKGVFEVGQGLNLTKDNIISPLMIHEHKIDPNWLIPFFTNADGAPYHINRTINYLLDHDKISKDTLSFFKSKNINIPKITTKTRQIPALILPRGIGRHFCAYNAKNAYSASFVEIYMNKDSPHLKNIWIFLNSSIGWLMRELYGRKNLGGGMLKAEAIDLKEIPVLYDFSKFTHQINICFTNTIGQEAQQSLSEMDSDIHQQIDDIVFEAFGYTNFEKDALLKLLKRTIMEREEKARSK
ncbi:MAG: class I SAM-dependent DNA methyltransferase [Chitinophagia bacterium]|nr:class I SAM-dependent DNA methyltransferase [Chitinophagia bacterium]